MIRSLLILPVDCLFSYEVSVLNILVVTYLVLDEFNWEAAVCGLTGILYEVIISEFDFRLIAYVIELSTVE
jgi:hypothetical protein